MIAVRGILVPNIDYNVLQKNVLFALSRKTHPLTGNEVRFIRQYLQMTFTEFANRFGVTHVLKSLDSFNALFAQDPLQSLPSIGAILKQIPRKRGRK